MSGVRKAGFRNLLARSLIRLVWLLSFGICGSFSGKYGSFKSASGRYEFIADYVLLALFLAMILSGVYRLLLYCDILAGLHYYLRRVIFVALMAPAIYLLFLGEIRRLNDLCLWRGFILLNFIPIYGFGGLLFLLAVCPKFLRR